MNQEAKETKTVSWLPILILLIGLPMASAAILAIGMGNPQPESQPETIFSALGTQVVQASEFEALEYKELLFSRLLFANSAERKGFLLSLKDFEVARGRAIKPISFKLQRNWWDPPKEESGTFWRRGKNIVWNPDSRPNCFFVVAEKSLAAGE